METEPFAKKVMLGVLVALVILSTLVLSSGLSGYIVGVPSSCKSKLSIEAPESLEAYQGDMASFEVKIYNVSCGVSYARLELYTIEDDWYDTAPTSIGVIPPGEEKSFMVYLDVPLDAELKTYSTPYRIYTNEGTFTVGNLELILIEPEKPKAEITNQISTGEGPVQTETNLPFSENAKFWYGIALLASILAIAMLGTDVFKRVEAFDEASKRRTGEELSKAMGKKTEKKKKLEKALKKNK
ncbi:MAG: hypothetical protein R6U26_03415 [Candidatus Undinarchaeales archaeon]